MCLHLALYRNETVLGILMSARVHLFTSKFSSFLQVCRAYNGLTVFLLSSASPIGIPLSLYEVEPEKGIFISATLFYPFLQVMKDYLLSGVSSSFLYVVYCGSVSI